MNNKLEKYIEERDKITVKLAELEERRKALEGKIMEAENLEIRAMMRSENLSLTELMDLVRRMQVNHRAQFPVHGKSEDAWETEKPRLAPDAYESNTKENADDEET